MLSSNSKLVESPPPPNTCVSMENFRILGAWEGQRRILQIILEISENFDFNFLKFPANYFSEFDIFEALEPREFDFKDI